MRNNLLRLATEERFRINVFGNGLREVLLSKMAIFLSCLLSQASKQSDTSFECTCIELNGIIFA